MQPTRKIILGTVQFGLEYGINNKDGKPNPSTVDELLNTAFSLGVSTLDTAEVYGNAHVLIGNYHKRNPDKVFKINTKLSHIIGNEVNKRIALYLQQLNVFQIEVLLFHSFEFYKQNAALIKQLNSYKRDKIIKYLGVSVYTNEQFRQVIEDKTIEVVQLPFNLLDNVTHRGELMQNAKKNGKIVHTRSTFLQGLFFASPTSNSSSVVKLLHTELAFITRICHEYEIPIQKLALSYCLMQENIDSVIIGVDNLNQLSQNLANATFELSTEVIEMINSIHVKDTNLLNPSLWRLLEQ